MPADVTSSPDVLAGFAARGVGRREAVRLVELARAELTDDELLAAQRVLAETRLLSWPDCVRFILLRRPVG
ncbi:MAG TPA: hypothetical protein VMB79_14555 [Jatrophihabitans sp.]|nr:hypothetical protein [Jatrophihabitans sp.]